MVNGMLSKSEPPTDMNAWGIIFAPMFMLASFQVATEKNGLHLRIVAASLMPSILGPVDMPNETLPESVMLLVGRQTILTDDTENLANFAAS